MITGVLLGGNVADSIPQIDCSHGNSSKQHRRQADVAENIVSVALMQGLEQ